MGPAHLEAYSLHGASASSGRAAGAPEAQQRHARAGWAGARNSAAFTSAGEKNNTRKQGRLALTPEILIYDKAQLLALNNSAMTVSSTTANTCKLLNITRTLGKKDSIPTTRPTLISAGLINARSAYKHATEVHDVILENGLDILAITETWFIPGCLDNLDELLPNGFKILTKSRPKKRGGGSINIQGSFGML